MRPSLRRFNSQDEFYIDEGCYIAEISNSEDDPDISIARARVEPGVTTKLHRLLDTIERYVILEGEGLVELEGMTSQKVVACDVVIIPPACAQKITNTGASDLIFLVICSPRFENSIYQEVKN